MTRDLHSQKLEGLLARARRMIRLLPHMDSGVIKTPLELAMQSLIQQQEILNFVQVDANDGKYNDPLCNFMIANKDQSRILLIEPQRQIIPVLKQNYETHPQSIVANYAIGSDEEFTLFGVDPSAWKECQVPHENAWPKYRVATGIASGNRLHIEDW